MTDADPGGQADGPARTSRILGPGSRRHRGGTEEGARGALIAAASTLVFVVVAAWLISRSPNWPKVRDQFFNAEEFAASWPDVLRGFWVDVQMFLYGLLAIPVVALVLAVARASAARPSSRSGRSRSASST